MIHVITGLGRIGKSAITASIQMRSLANSPKGGFITGVVLYTPRHINGLWIIAWYRDDTIELL